MKYPSISARPGLDPEAKVIAAKIPGHLHEWLREQAAREDRTMSQIIRRLLTAAAAEAGGSNER